MTTVSSAAVVTQANALLTYIKKGDIPYVAGGMSLTGMDCQGLVEYCLIQAGIPKAECNLAGSNAHYRKCVWTGTPEEAVARFGKVPAGASLYILEQDGGEPDKYKADGIGNASHMGIWTGKESIAASASKGNVIQSNFNGKTIHGGWNRVGLEPWVDYGVSQNVDNETMNVENGTKNSTPTMENWKSQFSHLTFALGSLGNGTREIQTGLNRLGYGLAVDGQFGPLTDTAVQKFQRENGLKVDGIVGPMTWAALIRAVNQIEGTV